MTYNRYDNAKIYRITNNANDLVYIGSTCLPLRTQPRTIPHAWIYADLP
jgi:hypothetical protein